MITKLLVISGVFALVSSGFLELVNSNASIVELIAGIVLLLAAAMHGTYEP